jgi:regulator of RNase E activity RraA
MEVRPGDLLHGDQHGVLTVPAEIASRVPAAADRLKKLEKRVIDLCRSPDFSVAKLRDEVNSLR